MPGDNHRYNKVRHKIIVEAVRGGLYREQTAGLAGVTNRTLQRWLERGRDEAEREVPYRRSKYRRLWEDVLEAENLFESEMVQLIAAAARDGGPQNWPAAMTILERKYPHRYGKRDTTVIEGGDRPVVQVNVLGNPEVRELANQMLHALAAPKREADLELEASAEEDA